MQDTIIKGSGNSRTLASVPNFLTIYPTYEAFALALINRELPIDIGPLNPAGLDVRGTDLSKASLLTNNTEAAIWGNSGNRTVDAALSQLRSLISTAQSSANTANANMPRMAFGTYTGSYVSGTPIPDGKTLSFNFQPKLVIVQANYQTPTPPGALILNKNCVYATQLVTSRQYQLNVSWSGNSVTFKPSQPGSSDYYYYDRNGLEYSYIGIG